VTFGERLRQIREAEGLGQRELARRAGLSLSHLQYLERDAKRPGDATLAKLARHLPVTAADLRRQRDDNRAETELTLLLREVGPLTDEQRERLLKIAHEALATESRDEEPD
jgi:transcriptional regulator with XRE-family HTH domain